MMGWALLHQIATEKMLLQTSSKASVRGKSRGQCEGPEIGVSQCEGPERVVSQCEGPERAVM